MDERERAGLRVAQAPVDSPLVTARRGFFWVGLEPIAVDGTAALTAPMYVQWEAPAQVRHPYPVVLVHGGGGQGLDYLGTPDGRPGWATYLVQDGYLVYVVDRPGHGRSPYQPDVFGPPAPPPGNEFLIRLFAPETGDAAPHAFAQRHTQWPGGRAIDDPAMGHQLAAARAMAADSAAAQLLEQRRLTDLLDRIGPSVVVCHSAGGPAGWLVADARPDLVVALVAIEPVGPPFNPIFGPGSFAWGLTSAPLTYDPPADSPADLRLIADPPPVPGGPARILQAAPARRLASLARVPIAVVTGEASVFNHTDPIVVEVLRQAGCRVDHIHLAEHGIHGNGHAMMLERNNREVLDAILTWTTRQTTAQQTRN
jgi:pimeloyl-ACP methyl ester carboxylesterase